MEIEEYMDEDEREQRRRRIGDILVKYHLYKLEYYEWNEIGLSTFFAECYRSWLKYCIEEECWYAYANGKWSPDPMAVSEAGKEFTVGVAWYVKNGIDEEYKLNPKVEISDETIEALDSLRKRLGDRGFRKKVIDDAASVYPVHKSDFDSNPWLINCKNGTYDLKHNVFRPHDPNDMLTYMANVEYDAHWIGKCPRWEQFISEVTQEPDKARYLQKALGYSLLGMSNEECMFLLYGKTTRNGKSTLLNTISHLLGDYSTVANVSIICGKRDGASADPERASLKGKRFVTMSESNAYGRMDEEAIKQLTGGEMITARPLYSAPINFEPQMTMWLSCNDLPEVQDRTLFASGRMIVIEFNRHFSPEEQDKNLKHFFEEPDNARSIFKWLLDGYNLYRKEGLTPPPSVAKAIQKYSDDFNQIGSFIEEKLVREPEGRVSNKELFSAFKVWARQNGYGSIYNIRTFAREMERIVPLFDGKIIRPKNQVTYLGIKFPDQIVQG